MLVELVRPAVRGRVLRDHRKLQGQTAEEMSVVGIYAQASYLPEPPDVDAILASLGPEFDDRVTTGGPVPT
jgi:hypothetical protein